jgi:hypothetical protein
VIALAICVEAQPFTNPEILRLAAKFGATGCTTMSAQ